MRHDPRLQERFIADPSGVIAEYAGTADLPPQTLSETNRMIFAVLTNADLLNWLMEYAEEKRDTEMTREEFTRDFGDAILELGGSSPALDVIREAVRHGDTLQAALASAPFIHHSEFFLPGIAVTTDHKVEHHQTQDQVQDAQVLHTHLSTQNFETLPQEVLRPGDPDSADRPVVSPEWVRGTIDGLVRQAHLLRRSRLLETSEQDPG
ncbi:hypothetical protein [Planobispora longispora]|nr:hypothetical protein [Planobispora longispora]